MAEAVQAMLRVLPNRLTPGSSPQQLDNLRFSDKGSCG